MKSPAEFRIDVYEKRDARLASRKKARRRALLCAPLAAAVLVVGIFAGPRLFSVRQAFSGDSIARTLQVGKPAEVKRPDVWEETEKQMGKEYPDMTEKEMAEFDRLYEEIRNLSSVDPAFQKALNDFARDSTLTLYEEFEENDCYCPLSLYYALALAGQGANGKTQEEFLEVMGAKDLPWMAEQCQLFYQNFYQNDPDYATRTLANSLWMDGRCTFKDDYLSTAENDLFSSLFQADFTSEATGQEMTKWISENTNGLLEPEFKYGKDYNDNTLLTLINTVYLKAQWNDQFMAENNEEGDFTKADGSTVKAEYMCQTNDMAEAYLGDGFTRAARGLYGGGAMVFILPDEGVSPQELLSDPDTFEKMFYPLEDGEATECELHWRVPKFTVDSKFDLMDPLRKLGLTTALDPVRADFSGMTDDADLYIASGQQGVHAAIDEDGVEAAAYTELAMAEGAAILEEQPVIEMNLNRPFLFAITADLPLADPDSADGSYSFGSTVIFVGVCGDPTK